MCREFSILLAAGIVLSSARAEPPARPNAVVLLGDDLGWGDLASHGNRNWETPSLDRLADSGMRLEKFHVCPNGSTTLASLLTGRYHYRTGASGESPPESVMYPGEITLGEIFAENGYATAYFGRWHHGVNWPHTARAQGFGIHRDSPIAEDLAGEAIGWIATAEEPFLAIVYLPLPRMGNPAALTPTEREEVVRRGVLELDRHCADLLDALEVGGRRNRTVVFFLSDNGPDFFGHRTGRYNGHLYGGRGSVHEGGVRVPCFASFPGTIPAGSRFTRITAHIDLLPTLVELCGLAQPEDALPLDGISLTAPLRRGTLPANWPNRILFTAWTPPGFDWRRASAAVRTDRWLALRDPRWRRTEDTTSLHEGWELYDLRTDPFQDHDMASAHPFLLADLRADFGFWMDDTTDDGLGLLPVEIGHAESPTVILRPLATDATEHRWPLRVVAPVSRRIEIVYRSALPLRGRLSAGDREFPLALGAAAEGAVILPGTIDLNTGIEEVTLHLDAPPTGALHELRLVP